MEQNNFFNKINSNITNNSFDRSQDRDNNKLMTWEIGLAGVTYTNNM